MAAKRQEADLLGNAGRTGVRPTDASKAAVRYTSKPVKLVLVLTATKRSASPFRTRTRSSWGAPEHRSINKRYG
jgi:hypothetical protein